MSFLISSSRLEVFMDYLDHYKKVPVKEMKKYSTVYASFHWSKEKSMHLRFNGNGAEQLKLETKRVTYAMDTDRWI